MNAAEERNCLGCGLPVPLGKQLCANCERAEREHHLHVVRHGHPCPVCGAEYLQ